MTDDASVAEFARRIVVPATEVPGGSANVSAGVTGGRDRRPDIRETRSGMAREAPLRPIPPGRRYRVVIADPPWRFANYSAKGDGKSPQAHYRCLSLDDLYGFARASGLDAALLPNCALLLWCTWPMAARGAHVAVIEAWGFRPSTGSIWLKTTRAGAPAFGTGKVLRNASEPYFIGLRGTASIASRADRGIVCDEETCPEGLGALIGPRGAHSVKPPGLHALADRLWPRGARIELFARRRHPGWDSYGDELGGFVAAAGGE